MVIAPRPTQLREPGLRRLPLGTERYRVKGAGSVVIPLEPGDRLEVVDPEGRQPCEVMAFRPDGRGATDRLTDGGTTRPEGVLRLLSTPDASGTALLNRFGLAGFDIGRVPAIRLFGQDGDAGATRNLIAPESLVCLIAAPGQPMAVDEQTPPTDLVVFVHRDLTRSPAAVPLPEPLADARLDFRIDRCTAQSYTVRAGEYIQIIDVEGRECSDFQAFSLAGLEAGVERCLDATTTRTLMGAAYPGPGLFSKLFDADMQPMLEVVRDTVGRHDAFALACSAKYYDDLGYPGHVNCSDNFNAALAPHGIQARRGWEAMNFFYNTLLDDHHQLYLDEPWSRPGDYVLVRALTDMVCVSSACPDDIDPANGWNPTDIHVRVYPAANTFSKAIAYRMSTDAEPELTRETAFHPSTAALTQRFGEYRGFWLPNSFDNRGAIDEYWACRERVAVMDLSPLRKFEVVGPDAEALLQWCVTRNVRKLDVGQVVYTAMCHDTGGLLDDGTVFRLGPDNFRWVGGDEFSGLWLRQQAAELGLRAWVKSSTDQLHNIAVQGPRSREVLEQIVWTPPAQTSLSDLKWFRFSIARMGDFDGIPILVSRTGYTGELGYEVWCHPKDATAVWQAVFNAGEAFEIAPLGLEALDMLRIEAGLIFAGAEFTDQTDPFEAGIGFAVPLKSKPDDFVGRSALERRKAHPQRQLVGLEIDGNEVAAHGDCIHIGRPQIGEVTSGTRSPILRKNIALARLAIEHCEVGTEIEIGKVDGHQKRLPAKVVPFPFYDPDKTRVRA